MCSVERVDVRTAVEADADDVLDAYAERLATLPDVRVTQPSTDVLVVQEAWTPRWAYLLTPILRLFVHIEHSAVLTIAVKDDGEATEVTIFGECRDSYLLDELEFVTSQLEAA